MWQLNEIDDEEIEDTFVLDRELDEPSSDGELPSQLKMTQLPSDLQEQIKSFLKAVRKVSPESIPDKRKRDEISLAVMHQTFERRLRDYYTSGLVDDDLAQLQDKQLSDRERMAIKVRHGEKVLLKEAIDLVVGKIGEIGVGAASEPSAKRQRTS